MSPVELAPLVVAIVCIQAIRTCFLERRVFRAFAAADAVRAANAKRLDELQLRESRLFRTMVRRGVVASAESGRWFLNQQQAESQRVRRMRFTLAAIGLSVAAVGGLWWYSMVS